MAQSSQMGVDSLRNAGPFQRNFLWDIIFAYDVNGTTGIQIGTLAQEIYFADYNVSPNIMRVGPYEAHFTGLFTVQEIRVKFLKPSIDFLSDYINSWKALMVDPLTGLFQPKSRYQKNIYVRFLDQTGNVVNQYKFVGCFPIHFPFYTLNYTASQIAETTVVFSVDKLEYSNMPT